MTGRGFYNLVHLIVKHLIKKLCNLSEPSVFFTA